VSLVYQLKVKFKHEIKELSLPGVIEVAKQLYKMSMAEQNREFKVKSYILYDAC